MWQSVCALVEPSQHHAFDSKISDRSRLLSARKEEMKEKARMKFIEMEREGKGKENIDLPSSSSRVELIKKKTIFTTVYWLINLLFVRHSALEKTH